MSTATAAVVVSAAVVGVVAVPAAAVVEVFPHLLFFCDTRHDLLRSLLLLLLPLLFSLLL